MTLYARLNAAGTVERVLELTAEQYVALQANGKAAWLRLWVVDSMPAATATHVPEPGAIVITATEARQTWVMRPKTPAELDAELNAADLATVKQGLTAIANDLAAYTANPDVTGTTVERVTKLEVRMKDMERQMRRTNIALRYYLRTLT